MSDNPNILHFKTHIEFYDTIKFHEQTVYQCPFLSKFKDYMDAAFQGCACRRQGNLNKGLELYQQLNASIDRRILEELKKNLNVEKFVFENENQILFDL